MDNGTRWIFDSGQNRFYFFPTWPCKTWLKFSKSCRQQRDTKFDRNVFNRPFPREQQIITTNLPRLKKSTKACSCRKSSDRLSVPTSSWKWRPMAEVEFNDVDDRAADGSAPRSHITPRPVVVVARAWNSAASSATRQTRRGTISGEERWGVTRRWRVPLPVAMEHGRVSVLLTLLEPVPPRSVITHNEFVVVALDSMKSSPSSSSYSSTEPQAAVPTWLPTCGGGLDMLRTGETTPSTGRTVIPAALPPSDGDHIRLPAVPDNLIRSSSTWSLVSRCTNSRTSSTTKMIRTSFQFTAISSTSTCDRQPGSDVIVPKLAADDLDLVDRSAAAMEPSADTKYRDVSKYSWEERLATMMNSGRRTPAWPGSHLDDGLSSALPGRERGTEPTTSYFFNSLLNLFTIN